MKKYFFRLIGIIAILWLLGEKEAFAQGLLWTDSLRVSIEDSTVVNYSDGPYLEFSIFIERTNASWNMSDTVLGNSDLYFYANFSAFDGDPQFVWVHDSLSTGIVSIGSGNPNAVLQANVGVWAERLHIALTRQDAGQGNAILGVNVNSGAKYKLRLAVGKREKLCTVRWKLRTPLSVILGIKWDTGVRGATGLQTYGGNPIIEALTGDVEKLPSDLLNVDCMEKKYYVCEKGPLSIGLHAESTGKGLVYEWYDSLPGAPSYPIVSTDTLQNRTLPTGKNYTYHYKFNGEGDTLYIDEVPLSIDSIYFYCLVKDTTLTTHPEVWCGTQLIVRDQIKGFISPLSDDYVANRIDTITKCAGQETVDARFNFYGVSENELTDIDSVYMIYWVDPCDGGPLSADTVKVGITTLSESSTQINGETVYYWQDKVMGKGKVFIHKIWTRYCDNALVAVDYDTVFIKEDNLQMLPLLTVASGQTIIMDSINSPVFTYGTSNWPITTNGIVSLRGLGSISRGPLNKLPFSYTAKDTTGLDTVLYKMPEGQCAYMREIEVQDLKYLTLKVYLWGAWREGLNSMYAFMGDVSNVNTFTKMQDLSGAYFVSPYNPDVKITTNRLREIVQKRKDNGELGFVDWLEVAVVEADSNIGSLIYPFNIIKKVDSLSCFLREDGIVCDTAGNPYIGFKNLPQNDYYVVVRHRNHLGIMSNVKIALSSSIPSGVMLDFTSTIAPIAGITNVAYYKPPTINNYFMYVGDVDANEKITTADRNKIQLNVNSSMNYYVEDIDFNLRVNTVDINTWGTAKANTATGYINPTQAFIW
ncbi:hypothetical protein [Odoribacter lunatus]|uniref:hypothetical protein n=1 Tax=Odoribacter lunatus TaxID=2941335 RepID=UPI002041C16F|nr:hypothetical protein [Odoribacter lunatus]